MPIYAYRCSTCGHAQDVLRKISDPPLNVCPACSNPTFVKQVTAAGFQLKGSGWYVTDFRGDAKAKRPADAGEAKEGAPADGGGEAKEAPKGDGKPDEAKKGEAKKAEAKKADAPVAAAPAAAAPAPAPSTPTKGET
jgi:putative FmdB family regulatory protein